MLIGHRPLLDTAEARIVEKCATVHCGESSTTASRALPAQPCESPYGATANSDSHEPTQRKTSGACAVAQALANRRSTHTKRAIGDGVPQREARARVICSSRRWATQSGVTALRAVAGARPRAPTSAPR